MKVVNPHYKSAVQVFAEQNANVISNYIAGKADQKHVSFDQIRADFPDMADPKTGAVPMTDGTLAAIFKHLGLTVEE